MTTTKSPNCTDIGTHGPHLVFVGNGLVEDCPGADTRPGAPALSWHRSADGHNLIADQYDSASEFRAVIARDPNAWAYGWIATLSTSGGHLLEQQTFRLRTEAKEWAEAVFAHVESAAGGAL